jgi:hypothetical protein
MAQTVRPQQVVGQFFSVVEFQGVDPSKSVQNTFPGMPEWDG